MENIEIARLLSETADLMEIGGEDGFRIRSYRNAASVIEGYGESLNAVVGDPSRKLTDIGGIGKGIAGAIEEIIARGSFARRDEMLEKYPPTALEMLRIQGLGPKSIRMLWEIFRVSTLEDLERLCREQKIRELPRMGAKLEEKILRGIQIYRQSAGRFLLNFASNAAEELRAHLLAAEGVQRVTPAGSLRRGKETVGDLDLLVTGDGATAALEAFVKHPRVHDVLGHGTNKASARFGLEGLQVDVRAVPEESFGAALQYFTGSKEHNVQLRQRAQKMGLTLNEYGLFKLSDESLVAAATEEEIYAALGLRWIPPELRENQGEIEAAAQGEIPALLELSEIRGDLHMHTRESDGRATLEEMAEAAQGAGLRVHRGHRPLKGTGNGQWIGRAQGGRICPAGEGLQHRGARDSRVLGAGVRHHARWPDGSERGGAGGVGLRRRKRPQPHEHRKCGDDGAADAGIGESFG